ncbi:DoxX family protein [Sphingomonas sp. GM_Shp_2]|uniref:DoxX family protein n=1 Tax=Sphingomonas sp. GM_Shp_2 TaxID=2937380 RepID=UPI00226AFD43|nr:DoxX family protein [Sphingomonas sp. GM_Shp_2]
MTTDPFAPVLRDQRFAIAAATLLTLPYWTSGLAKLVDLSGALAEAEHFGLHPAAAIVALTILVQVGGALLVIAGRLAWLGAGALGVFTTIATLIAHPFWTVADPMARFHERNSFLEHAGLIGGLMLAAIVREKTR